MNTDNLLMQYQSEALEALKSMTNLGKPFEKVIMDVLKLFMAIPGKINFLQMGRYGQFSEQTYRNTFTKGNFDWFDFNQHLAEKVCTGSFLALAVDPSYIPKSGKKTPWFGKFWSGAAGEAKKGLELTGIGLMDVDNHECMTLGAFQTPDSMTLEDMDYNLIDWYREQLISRKDRLLPITRTAASHHQNHCCRCVLLQGNICPAFGKGGVQCRQPFEERRRAVLPYNRVSDRKTGSPEIV